MAMPCEEDLAWMCEVAGDIPPRNSPEAKRLLDVAARTRHALDEHQQRWLQQADRSIPMFSDHDFELKATAGHVHFTLETMLTRDKVPIDDGLEPVIESPHGDGPCQMALLRQMASTPEQQLEVQKVAASALQSAFRRHQKRVGEVDTEGPEVDEKGEEGAEEEPNALDIAFETLLLPKLRGDMGE